MKHAARVVWRDCRARLKRFRFITQISSVGVWVIAWLLLADLLQVTGAAWFLTESSLKEDRRYAVVQQLFETPTNGAIDILVIGDTLFSARLKKIRPEIAEKAYFLSVPGFNLSDVSSITAALRRTDVRSVVIQASPHLWTDYWFREPALLYKPYAAYGSFAGPSLDRFKSLIDTVQHAAQSTQDAESFIGRPESMLATWAMDTPKRARKYRKQIAKMADSLEHVFWVKDMEGVPIDLPGRVQKDFEARLSPIGYNADFGNVAAGFEDLVLSDDGVIDRVR